jgi:hypothetical protein
VVRCGSKNRHQKYMYIFERLLSENKPGGMCNKKLGLS